MHMSPYVSEQGILHRSKFGLCMYMNKGENELVDPRLERCSIGKFSL